jgi:hypothetical protein
MNDEFEGQPPIDYFDDVGTVVTEPATLERLSNLAKQSIELERAINDATVALAELQGQHDKIMRRTIPDIMTELAMEEFKMSDGSVISVKEDIKCGLTEERKPAAFTWLEENHFDGIIKTSVNTAFGKGEVEKAKQLIEMIAAAGFSAEMSRSVHPATLKSFVKEQLEAGFPIPIDTFGVFEFKQAKIKLPKARK